MHNPFSYLCLVAFCFLDLGNPLPATVPNSLSIFQEPAVASNGTNISLPLLLPLHQNSTHKLTSLPASSFTIAENVSHTEMTLYFQYTSWLVHTKAIERLLNATKVTVQRQVYQQGTAARLISTSNGEQSFRNSIPGGMQLRVENLIPWALTWGDMAALMIGLEEWCSYWTCRFQFSVGSGGLRIGEGAIY